MYVREHKKDLSPSLTQKPKVFMDYSDWDYFSFMLTYKMLLLEWTSAVTASIPWKPKVVSKNRRCSKRERGQHSAQDGLKSEKNSH